MLYLGGLGSALLLLFWLFCVIDVIMSPESECRNLPKLAWLAVVLLFSFVGGIAWFVAGRPRGVAPGRSSVLGAPAGAGAGPRFPEYDRPGRSVATNPDDDAEFLARVRERAAEQRRREAARRRAQERAERADRHPDGGESRPDPA